MILTREKQVLSSITCPTVTSPQKIDKYIASNNVENYLTVRPNKWYGNPIWNPLNRYLLSCNCQQHHCSNTGRNLQPGTQTIPPKTSWWIWKSTSTNGLQIVAKNTALITTYTLKTKSLCTEIHLPTTSRPSTWFIAAHHEYWTTYFDKPSTKAYQTLIPYLWCPFKTFVILQNIAPSSTGHVHITCQVRTQHELRNRPMSMTHHTTCIIMCDRTDEFVVDVS